MLTRGQYGIEYDEQQNPSGRNFWWAVLFVPLVALGFVFIRGCGDETQMPVDDPLQAPRFDAPETRPYREEASLVRHFFGKWFTTNAPAAVAKARQKTKTEADVVPRPATPPEPPLSEHIRNLLEQATSAEHANHLLEARRLFIQVLGTREAREIQAFVEQKIGDLNIRLALLPEATPGKSIYKVVQGDSISRLTKRFGCPQDYLLYVNTIKRPEHLRIGQSLWVLDNPKFELTVAMKKGRALLMLNGQFFKRYVLPATDTRAPLPGAYVIQSRQKKTVSVSGAWNGLPDDKPRNPRDLCSLLLADPGNGLPAGIQLLGSRAWDADVPMPQAQAQLRFRNADIEELYLLLPAGTPVTLAAD